MPSSSSRMSHASRPDANAPSMITSMPPGPAPGSTSFEPSAKQTVTVAWSSDVSDDDRLDHVPELVSVDDGVAGCVPLGDAVRVHGQQRIGASRCECGRCRSSALPPGTPRSRRSPPPLPIAHRPRPSPADRSSAAVASTMVDDVTVVDVGSGDVVVVGDPVGGALAIGSSESELHADASSVRHAAKAAARRKAATADAPSTAKPRRPSDPQRLNPLAEKLRARALVRNAEVLLAMSAPSISSSAKKHSDVRGGTLIAVGSHEPFIGDVTSNIRPHEQKSRTATRLNGFASGQSLEKKLRGRTQPQRFPDNRRFAPVESM